MKKTITLEPNCDALYRRFESVLDAEADELVDTIKEDAATLHAVQSCLAPLAVAFQSARTSAQVVQLRDHISNALKQVAEAAQVAEVGNDRFNEEEL
jgi:hypothetical protein